MTPTVDLIDYRRIVAAALNRAKSYPPAARRRVLEGRVVIGITIESDGTVTNPTIETSSGHSLLDTDALATAGRLALPPPPAGRVTLQLALSYRLTE
ncbi:MAG: energy transducer TonB [Alphaproteobacteria bacterium]|nr:energy transducer TonB [Alphaproteobacteria bacterium]